MIKSTLLAALVAMPQIALAATPACLPAQDFADGVIVIAPAAIEAVAAKCGPSLADGAFLRSGHKAMSEGFRAYGATRKPQLRAIFRQMAEGPEMDGVSDATLTGLLTEIAANEINKAIKPGDCGEIDAMLRNLAPLPPQNVGMLLAGIVRFGDRDEKDGPKFNICPIGTP